MPTLLELLASSAAPTPPPPKKPPASPLARSLLILGGAPARTTQEYESINSIWTPQDRELFLPPREVGGALLDLRAPHPPIKPLTLTEQFAQFGKAIQSIPEAPAKFGAAFREGIENLKVLGGAVVKGLDWLDRHFPAGPLDPYRRPVPRWNVQLYLLARRAYEGDVEAQARFLDEIKAEGTDALTYIQALLRPTFEPSPQDLAGRRRAWEQSPPEDARHWLRKRLSNLRSQQEAPRNGKVDVGDIEHLLEAPAHPEANPELWAFYQSEIEMWRNRAREILTPKRYEVFLLLEEGYSPEEIAHTRRRDSGTIRKQVWEIRNNPQLRAMGDQLREQLWWGQPRWE